MDEILLLTRPRWQLRRAIRQLAEFFDLSGFERHPEKTQTGRISHGFDWLGIWFYAVGVCHMQQADARVLSYETRRTRRAESMLNAALSDY